MSISIKVHLAARTNLILLLKIAALHRVSFARVFHRLFVAFKNEDNAHGKIAKYLEIYSHRYRQR